MEIRVSGHQIDTGAALQDHAAERTAVLVETVRVTTSHRTFRPPRQHTASAEELARHKAFVETLESPLWAS